MRHVVDVWLLLELELCGCPFAGRKGLKAIHFSRGLLVAVVHQAPSRVSLRVSSPLRRALKGRKTSPASIHIPPYGMAIFVLAHRMKHPLAYYFSISKIDRRAWKMKEKVRKQARKIERNVEERSFCCCDDRATGVGPLWEQSTAVLRSIVCATGRQQRRSIQQQTVALVPPFRNSDCPAAAVTHPQRIGSATNRWYAVGIESTRYG